MKVMLINPYFRTHTITPPLGLVYLASSLRSAGQEVTILDCLAKEIDPEKIEREVQKQNPDIVGITAMTTCYSEALRYVEKTKELGVLTMLGGPHVSARPTESLRESKADFVVYGEGERSIVELVNAIESKSGFSSICGIGYKNQGEIVINPGRDLIEDLNTIPMPAWDLMPPKEYPPAPHGAVVKRFPVAPIVTTRGCPFNCAFCASKCIWQHKLRFRSAKNLVDEIELLVNEYSVRELHFEDDNFTANREHALSICNEIVKRKLDITWACPNGVRIDELDQELLIRMKESGCYLLAFGIESGSQKILDGVNKKLDINMVQEVIRMVKDVGITTWGFFIIGLPGETKETARETIEFAKKMPLDRAQFCMFTPLPGSDAYDEWVRREKIEDFEWENFNFYSVVCESDSLQKKDLAELQRKAFREFYFRPKILFNLVKNIKPQQIRWILRRMLAYKYFG